MLCCKPVYGVHHIRGALYKNSAKHSAVQKVNRMNENKTWDYTEHAKYYDNRPNYAQAAIAHLCEYVGAKKTGFLVADIGAGTGNLTIMLKDSVEHIT